MSDLELRIDVDTAGLEEALVEASRLMTAGVRDAVRKAATDLRDDWRSNARATARRHGKLYPRSITTDAPRGDGEGIVADVGPRSAAPQGGMGRGFEYGSVNQPPHMDGARALVGRVDPFERHVEDVVDQALAELGGIG